MKKQMKEATVVVKDIMDIVKGMLIENIEENKTILSAARNVEKKCEEKVFIRKVEPEDQEEVERLFPEKNNEYCNRHICSLTSIHHEITNEKAYYFNMYNYKKIYDEYIIDKNYEAVNNLLKESNFDYITTLSILYIDSKYKDLSINEKIFISKFVAMLIFKSFYDEWKFEYERTIELYNKLQEEKGQFINNRIFDIIQNSFKEIME